MEFKQTKKIGFSLPPENQSQTVYDARYHPNNNNGLLGVTTIAGNVYMVENNKVISKLKKHHKGSAIRKIRFDNDGHMVTIAKTVKIYDLDTKQTTHTLKRGDSTAPSLYSVKPLGESIICAGDDNGDLFVWDTRTQETPIFSSSDCEQYISDIDGKYESRRLIVCTSGEGTLTAYDLRVNKMITPQSELFEAGFQCVKLVEQNKKVVIGGEDGAVYVFNQNEWAHTSGKFAIGDDTGHRGKSSIEAIEILPDNSNIFLAACSDGRMRSFTLWPHEILTETALCKSSLESIHVNPNTDKTEIVISGDNNIYVLSYEEKSDESEKDDAGEDSSNSPSSAGNSSDGSEQDAKKTEETNAKKMKTNNDDYLNVFN